MKISVCVAVLQEKKFAMDNTIIIPYSDVESKKEWLWKYRLPHKNVAFLYGSSEDAVEALITEIIASVSMGRALAVDNMNRQAGRVIYQDFKDGQIDAVKASLERQKADCSNIAYVNFNCKKAMECIQELEKGIEEFQPSLVVLRNISQCMEKQKNLYDPLKMAPILHRLMLYATRYNCSILLAESKPRICYEDTYFALTVKSVMQVQKSQQGCFVLAQTRNALKQKCEVVKFKLDAQKTLCWV
jgi:hypothetical protein